MFHKCSKHIDLWHYWICDLIQGEIVSVESCCDPEQTADMLTKALPRVKHKQHIDEMGLVSI